MSVDIQLNAVFKVDGTVYDATMSIPTSKPTKNSPFLFNVTSKPDGDDEKKASSVLTVAVGGDNQVYVAVAPPHNLISAVAGDVVQSLNVVVSEGKYNQETKKFEDTPAITDNSGT